MKYIVIFDDEFLSNFRVDVRSNGEFSDKVLVLTDKAGAPRGIGLKPLQEPMIVSKEGNGAYLSQENIDCLIAMEKKQMLDKVVKDIVNSFKRQGEE